MDKVAVEKLIAVEKEKRAHDVARADELFNKLLTSVDKSTQAYSVIEIAKWLYDINRHSNLLHHMGTDLPEEQRVAYYELSDLLRSVPYGYCLKTVDTSVGDLLDSEKKHIKGDLIITDPCYIIKDECRPAKAPVMSDYVKDINTYDDVVVVKTAELLKHLPFAFYESIDEETCKYSYKYDFANTMYKSAEQNYEKSGKNYLTDDWMETIGYTEAVERVLGIHNYIGRDTLFGDWSCVVIDEEGELIGSFGADAGMVCVAELNEWREYNPNVDDYIANHSWCVAVIDDFDGDVWFEVEDTSFYDTEKDGSSVLVKDYTVHVCGEGTRKGKAFKFKTEMGMM